MYMLSQRHKYGLQHKYGSRYKYGSQHKYGSWYKYGSRHKYGSWYKYGLPFSTPYTDFNDIFFLEHQNIGN